jgi:polar amino acid transport system permease protein
VILSIITVPELMYQVGRMSAETFRYLETNLVLALFFWLLVEAISRLGRRLEARVTKHLIEERS